jgi:hypothetical protein
MYAGETAISAMKFLGNCFALIIDLRDNGGGSPSMVQLISSYLLEESTHLNSFYIRESDQTKQFWTQEFVDGKRLEEVPVYILTSKRTFSGAEEFTYNMKNLERATIIGETTGGGAHPCRRVTFKDLKVKLSLPYGRAVNPITGTNWEGTGIEPHIQVPRDQALEVAKLEAMKKIRGMFHKRAHEAPEIAQLAKMIDLAIKRLESLKNPHEIAEAAMMRYAGTYGPRRVTLEDGVLYYQREGRPKYRMIPVADTIFCFEELDYFLLEVELDDSGNPAALVGIYDSGRTDRSPRSGD